jgi:opacity protein-like surface antigen
MRRSTFLLTLSCTLLAVPTAASAQLQAGPYLAYHDDADLGIGGFLVVPLYELHENLSFVGDFGFYFPGDGGYDGVDVDYWEANADALFSFPLENQSFTPWALAGINIAHGSVSLGRGPMEGERGSDTEIGLNLGGGVTFGTGSMRPMVGAKFELDGGEGAVIFGGLSFLLGTREP